METGDVTQSGHSRSGSRTRSRIEDARALAPVCQEADKSSASSETDPRNRRTSGSAVSWLRGCKASTDDSGDGDGTKLADDLNPDGLPPPPPPPPTERPPQYMANFVPSSRSSSKSSAHHDVPPPPPGQPPQGIQAPQAPGGKPPTLGSQNVDDLLNSTLDSLFLCPGPPAEDPPSLPPPPKSEVSAEQKPMPQHPVEQASGTPRKPAAHKTTDGETTDDNADGLSEALQALGIGNKSRGGKSHGGRVTLRPEGVRAIVAALQDGNLEQSLISEICDALEAVLLCSESCLSSFMRAGGLDVLSRIMQQYSYHADIQVSVCRILQHLVASESTIAEKVVTAGFFEAAADAMQRFTSNADVQSAVSPVVELIACQCPNLRGRAAAAGLVEALIAAMKLHVDDTEVQQVACAALQVLISPAKASDDSDSLVSRAYDAGAVNVSVSAMQSHKSDQRLQYWPGLLVRGIAHGADQKMKSDLLSKLHWQGIQVAGL